MAEYSNSLSQTINPGESFVFTFAPVPCDRGLVRWRPDSGAFNLSGWAPSKKCNCKCHCNCDRAVRYLVDFGANIAIPDGQTVQPISVAFALDGTTLAETTMIVTPAAVEEYFNISRAAYVPIWNNCCQTVTVRNTSTIPILAQNSNIIFSRPDLLVSY